MPFSPEEDKKTTAEDLKEILTIKYFGADSYAGHYDQILPGLFLGDMSTAKNILKLEELKITHVLNAAYSYSPYSYSETSEVYYAQRNFGCKFLGIPAQDFPTFKICDYFEQTSDFIEQALQSSGKVFAHCLVGISRSATIVIAYLMIKEKMSAIEALTLVRGKRAIYPNEGFLQQIADLEYRLKHPPRCLFYPKLSKLNLPLVTPTTTGGIEEGRLLYFKTVQGKIYEFQSSENY